MKITISPKSEICCTSRKHNPRSQNEKECTTAEHFIRQVSIISKRLILCSDTHEMHSSLTWPEGDILVYAGDFTLIGRPEKSKSLAIDCVAIPSTQLL